MTKNLNSLIHLSNSLRQYYGLKTYHPTDTMVDEWLHLHRFSNIIVILIDGMGYDHVKNIPNSFLNLHCKTALNSVFPPNYCSGNDSFSNREISNRNRVGRLASVFK